VWGQDFARHLLEHARTHAYAAPIEQQLAEAGFAEQGMAGMYRKDVGNDTFAINVSKTGVWLIFEPENETYWHNLAIFHHAQAWQDGDHYSPIFWPNTVEDPMRAMVGMALEMTRAWKPEMIAQRKTERRAKPRR
jgi:hypothetical protein